MNLGAAGEDGGRSHGLEHPQDTENREPGISFNFDTKIYKGTGNSETSIPVQVLKMFGRLAVKVSISQFTFSVKHRLTTNGDNSWST